MLVYSTMDSEINLADLANKLRAVQRLGLATQKEIQRVTGVDQGMVSRVANGKRRTVTEPVVRLNEYVNMLLSGGALSAEIRQAAREFLGRGGSEAELIASIEHSADLVSRRLVKR